MSNPITGWIKDNMEPYAEREAEMIDRVAETNINAQKIVDERHGPYRGNYWWRNDRRSREFRNFFVAHSAYKGQDAGYCSSFKAYRYYSDESAKRRNELLEKFAAEELKK